MPNISSLSRAMGQGLAAQRTSAGALQEEVARAARRFGLNWTRATVAAIELGRREVPLDEIILLPGIVYEISRRHVTIGDLFAAAESPLKLTDRMEIDRSDLQRVFSKRSPVVHRVLTPEQADIKEDSTPALLWLINQPEPLSPDEFIEIGRWGLGEAEQKAARSLGVLPGLIGPACYRLWGRPLAEERDARLGDTSGQPARTVQARRGHITRELLIELEHKLLEAEQQTGPVEVEEVE